MKFKFYRFKIVLMAALIGCSVITINVSNVYAAQKLYDQVQTEMVTKGVVYEKNHRLTAEGWQDIYTIKIDLNDPNIRVAPVESNVEYGLKETVLKMVNDNGAVAGVNASFFGMNGKYSASFGLTVDQGELISAGSDINSNKNEYATFFLDNEDNPFIDFFKVNFEFLADGKSYFDISSVNKVADMVYPTYFDRNAASSTKDLDVRFPGLAKIVVEDDVITKISAKGETVEVPENGYLIVISSNTYDYNVQNFRVGQKAEFKVNGSMDLSKIQMGISGAGKILVNGTPVKNEGVVIANRQPRTALGISQDENTLILMVVDGRGNSIGATPDEMAALMKEYGAFNALHFDGGGSTTIAVKTADEEKSTVKNKVSDGAERKVINALGVFNDAPVGALNQIVIKPSKAHVFKGSPVSFEVIGYDEYYHKVPVPINEVVFSSNDEGGVFEGNQFNPSKDGKILVTATYGGFSAVADVEGMTLASVKPSVDTLNMQVGQSVNLNFSGVSTEGFEGKVSNLNISSDLGVFENNTFTATKEGTGYIKCNIGEASCYVRLTVGGTMKNISSFENEAVKFSSYPTSITGSAGSSSSVVADGSKALELKYKFVSSTDTQAAYLHFENPIKISGSPSALKMSVYGNNSGQWLRGKLKDANGKEVIVDFTKNINWDGWQEVSGSIPQGVEYPLQLQTLYIAALSNENTAEQVLYFDKMAGNFPIENNVEVPANTAINDVKKASIIGKEEGSYYITLAGTVSSSNEALKKSPIYTDARTSVNNSIQNNTDLAVYAGKSDVSTQNSVETIKWNSGYKFYDKNGVSIVQLTAANGGMRNTNTWQWQSFKNDVLKCDDKNIIFMIDKTPSGFSDPLEAALFRSVLSDLRDAGKEIFVVSSSGAGSWTNIKEGIRYINLPDLWKVDGSLNKDFKLLTFKVTDGNMVYDMKNIF